MAKKKSPPQDKVPLPRAPVQDSAPNFLAVVDLLSSIIGVLLLLVVVGLFALSGATLASGWVLVALAALLVVITAIAIAAVFRRSFHVEGKVGMDNSAKADFN